MGLERVPSRNNGFLSPPRSRSCPAAGKGMNPLTVAACVMAVSLAALLFLNLEARFSTLPPAGGWKESEGTTEGGMFTLDQVQLLLAATNSSYEIASTDGAKMLFSAEQVAALVTLQAPQNVTETDPLARQLSPAETDLPARQLSPAEDEGTAETETGPSQKEQELEEKVRALLAAWAEAYNVDDVYSDDVAGLGEAVPRTPHLDDCKDLDSVNRFNDRRQADGSPPLWSQWSGEIDFRMNRLTDPESTGWVDRTDELIGLRPTISGPFPPWIVGADEDNMVLTRRVQRDLWMHQHPRDCNDPNLRFFYLKFFDAEEYHYGTGAQIQAAEGVFGKMIAEGRIVVFADYDRADHDGCRGDDRNRWSCYFAPETSDECRTRAAQLYADPEARQNKVITDLTDHPPHFWFVTDDIPKIWGKPWLSQVPTIEIGDALLTMTGEEHRRWWRSQATRYLMRYPSQYLCRLMNRERQRMFGYEEAKSIISSAGDEPPPAAAPTALAAAVWPRRRPYLMRPTIALHIRQGDKKSAGEMELFGLEDYMSLAEKVRLHHPDVTSILLTTEMEDIVAQAQTYARWRMLYTDVPRQQGEEPMWHYEKRMGRELSSANAFVNLMLSSEANYFVLTMGSTWSLLIDNLRSTNGRLRRGVLSVNRDRRWDWNDGVTDV
ncbi:hypothetical protein KFL_000840050 [Klebsormidium nitens]|uniref:O-fucosyltransferase family protein n=1 Tax=Klebsormidium nitens TaxID=105231 RepID=A0A1Y1HUQ9_KLENI|nr:hypothetical protein KFL_000840050 [Klebsormidium nitens]|eukprot:GAQ81562.1 hypothetical protein KFL_000840050 [Klebsormidium nitens]